MAPLSAVLAITLSLGAVSAADHQRRSAAILPVRPRSYHCHGDEDATKHRVFNHELVKRDRLRVRSKYTTSGIQQKATAANRPSFVVQSGDPYDVGHIRKRSVSSAATSGKEPLTDEYDDGIDECKFSYVIDPC